MSDTLKRVKHNRQRLLIYTNSKGTNMPRYYDIPNWEGRGNVRIIPKPWYRRLPILKQTIAYHVGDRIKFIVHTDNPNTRGDVGFSQVVYENFSGEYKRLKPITATDTEIEGNRINREGNVEYCIGYDLYKDTTKTIFTANVEDWDTIFSKWGWAFVGGFFSLLIGVLLWALGLIRLIPFWEIWIAK